MPISTSTSFIFIPFADIYNFGVDKKKGKAIPVTGHGRP
jgi:hypothetical protein